MLGELDDRRKVNGGAGNSGSGGNRSLFSMPPGFDTRKQQSESAQDKLRSSADWGGDGLIGLSGIGLGSKQKSLAEIFQVLL